MPDPTGRISHLPDMHRGVSWKQAVNAASTGNINLASVPGTIDGVTMASGSRFLAKDQTAGAENGIYTWASVSSNASRAFDMDQDQTTSVIAEEVLGSIVYVIAGTTNGGTLWRNTNTTTPILGTTSLTFSQLTTGGGGGSNSTTITTTDQHVHAIGEQITADGSSSTYYLANWPEDNTVAAYMGGLRTDITQSGDAVTFSGPPGVGTALRFDYIVEQT